MNHKNWKRVLSLLLVLAAMFGFLPTLGSPASAAQGTEGTRLQTLLTAEQLEAYSLIDRTSRLSGLIGFDEDWTLDGFGDDEMVSVIVEFVHQPPVIQQVEAIAEGDFISLEEAEELAELDHEEFEAELNEMLGVNPYSRSPITEYDITSTYTDAINGVAATLPADKLEEIAALDVVYAIYPNVVVTLDDTVESYAYDAAAYNGNVEGMKASRDYLELESIWGEFDVTGDGIVVGIIDTGVDYNHPDLQDAFSTAYSGNDEDFRNNGNNNGESKYYGRNLIDPIDAADLYPGALTTGVYDPMETTYNDWVSAGSESTGSNWTDFVTEHGTHVAGTVAGRGVGADGDEASSVLGVAPGATLLCYRALGPYGSGYTEWILAALEYVGVDGCDVVNMSLGYQQNNPNYITSVAVNNIIIQYGIVFAIACGNDGPSSSTLGSPSTSSLAISVGNGVLPYEAKDFKISSSLYMRLLCTDEITEFKVGSYHPRYPDTAGYLSRMHIWKNGVDYYGGGNTYNAAWTTGNSALYDTYNARGYLVIPLEDAGENLTYMPVNLNDASTWADATYDFDLGMGTRAEFEARADDIDGNIVLVGRGQAFVTTAALAKEFGALAVIVLDNPNSSSGGSVPEAMYEVSEDYVPLFLMMDAWDGTASSNDNSLAAVKEHMATKDNVADAPQVTVIDIFSQTTGVNGTPYKETSLDFSVSSSSSRGPVGSTMDIKPDIIAPGTNIISAAPFFTNAADPANPGAEGAYDGALVQMSGTSMAAPHIAGIAALMLEYSRGEGINNGDGWAAAEVKARLMNNATAFKPTVNGSYSVYEKGAGFVDPAAALGAASYVTVAFDDVAAEDDDGNYLAKTGELASFNFRSLKVGVDTSQTVVREVTIHNTGSSAAAYTFGYAKNLTGSSASGLSTQVISDATMWDANVAISVSAATTVEVPADGETTVTVTVTVPANLSLDDVGIYEGYIYFTNNATSEKYSLPFAFSLRPDTETSGFYSHPVITTADVYIVEDEYGTYVNSDYLQGHTYDSYFSTLYYTLGESAYEMYFVVADPDIEDPWDESLWIGQLAEYLDLRDSEPGVTYKAQYMVGPTYYKYADPANNNFDMELAIFGEGPYKIIGLIYTPYGTETCMMDFYVDNTLPELRNIDGLSGTTYTYSGATRDEVTITGNIYDAGLQYLAYNNIEYSIYEPTDPHGPEADQALNAIFARVKGSTDKFAEAEIAANGDFSVTVTGLNASGTTVIDFYYLDHFAICDYEMQGIYMASDFDKYNPSLMSKYGYPFAFYGANRGLIEMTVVHTGDAVTLDKQSATISPDDTLKLTAALTDGAGGYTGPVWSSSDTRVATVDSNGVVTPVAWGTAVITATYTKGGNSIYAGCAVTVTGINDGVSFDDYSYLWYGTQEYGNFAYTADSANTAVVRDGYYLLSPNGPIDDDGENIKTAISKIPMLWDIKGEEATGGVGDRKLTVLSTYFVDTMDYNDSGTWSAYGSSDINTWLNGTFIDKAFNGTEKEVIPYFAVTTDNATLTNQRAYIPWGVAGDSGDQWANSVFWTAGNEKDFDNSLKGASNWKNHRRARDTGVVQWSSYYLRNASNTIGEVLYAKGYESDVRSTNNWSFYGEALSWYAYGSGGNWTQSEIGYGVLPATKLDMGKILFAHPIADYYVVDYTTSTPAENDFNNWGSMTGYFTDTNWLWLKIDETLSYRITVLGGNDGTDIGTLGGISSQPVTVAEGITLSLTDVTSKIAGGAANAGDYKIAYKIVGERDGERTVLAYDEFAVSDTTQDLSLRTSNLDAGEYMVYMWLVKKNQLDSYEAGVVESFRLTVGSGGSSSSGGGSSTTYTITATAGEGGKITPSSATVVSGGSKTFTITVNEGYVISDVLVDGKSVGKVSAYTFSNVTANHTIRAVFVPEGEAEDPDVPQGSIPYTDVSKDDWFYDAVVFVTEYGLFNGVSETRFAPNENMSRAQFVTVMGRLAEKMGIDVNGYSCDFKDVELDSWYGKYVAWAAANDIVKGYGETFGVNDSITREQMAVLFIRFAGYMDIELNDGTEVEFSDAATISDWAREAVEKTASAGLMQGAYGAFDPRGTATRAQVAQVFARFVDTIGN